ncbi:MAG: N-6 DNA methylase [Pseudomonadota bacterium]|nr:N-6 DNA methylase [Pseudomonadota bacterium]
MDPRLLRYTDLIREVEEPLVDGVVEQQAQALLYVVDHARLSTRGAESVSELRRLLAMRGDPAWLGVLLPGRLDIYATDLRPDPATPPVAFTLDAAEAQAVLPRLAQGEDLAKPGSLRLRDELLRLMTDAGEELKHYGLTTHETIALTGRALFFRYLVGRKIVGEAHLANISRSAGSLKECFSSGASSAETNHWLDRTFNGDLLKLPNQDYAAYFVGLIRKHGNRVTRPLRAIMALDTSVAPGASQQKLDWGDLDFDHLPVGLLSETYEELMYRFDAEARRDTSVYYTPSHIAEYMVTEALHQHPAGASARVLDPACGAGVFLVACFRKLAELRFKETGQRPTRQALRTILDKQLTGFDTNAHARTLAALALYLTALELDPDPTPVEALTFNKLEGTVLIDVADPGSDTDTIVPMAGSLGMHVSGEYRGAFDLVIGNPPWTSLKSKYADIDKLFTRRCRAIAGQRGLNEIACNYHNPDKVPDLPFVWGAMDWAKPGGRIALALAGRWLFKMTLKGYAARRALFQALAITGILNGASLRQTKVWPNVDQPFSLLFADNRVPSDEDQFVLVSPDEEPLLSDKGRMRIDACDAVPVSLRLAAEQRTAIKTLYRGTALDMDIVERIHKKTQEFVGDYWTPKHGLFFSQGFQVASRANNDSFLEGKLALGARYSNHPFLVLGSTLLPYQPQGLHRPRAPDIYKAPLLLVRKGNRADRTRGRALVSDVDLAYSESYYGYSAARHPQGDFLVRYLLVLVHSRLFEYVTLMSSGEFGFEREALQVLDIAAFPFIPPEKLGEKYRLAIDACAAKLIANQPDWPELDRTVAQIYGLSERDQQIIADTLSTRAPFAAAKKRAIKSVTLKEAELFRARLETELTNVLSASGHRVQVSLTNSPDRHLPWRFLSIALNGRPMPPELPARWVEQADDLAASRITLIDAHEPCFTVGLLDRYRYWTSTQARLLASDLLWQHGAMLEERARR